MLPSFKCTDVCKTTVPWELKEGLQAKAHMAGTDASEYLRDLICMDLFGGTWGEHVANHRRSVIGRQGAALGQARASE